jgi:hypothetical protein
MTLSAAPAQARSRNTNPNCPSRSNSRSLAAGDKAHNHSWKLSGGSPTGPRTSSTSDSGILLDLGPGAEQKGLALKLIPFAMIAGTVLDPEGEPLAEARVALIGVSYRNDIPILPDQPSFALRNIREVNYCGQRPGGVGPKVGFAMLLPLGLDALKL